MEKTNTVLAQMFNVIKKHDKYDLLSWEFFLLASIFFLLVAFQQWMFLTSLTVIISSTEIETRVKGKFAKVFFGFVLPLSAFSVLLFLMLPSMMLVALQVCLLFFGIDPTTIN